MTSGGAAISTTESLLEHDGSTIHVTERPRDDSAIVLMHGFLDDHHIYDRLTPHLAGRHVVAFDWLGYGRSGRREAKPYERADRQLELAAVIDGLELDTVLLVGHDASGPEAIELALDRPERVEKACLAQHVLRPERWAALPGDDQTVRRSQPESAS